MDKLYDNVKDDLHKFIGELDTNKIINYTRKFGGILGLERHNERIYVSPQYVMFSHMMYPSYTGRMILFATTAVFVMTKEQ